MENRRIERRIDDLDERLDRHIGLSIAEYFFAARNVFGDLQLEVEVYSYGGEVELEALAFPDGNLLPICYYFIDGELISKLEWTAVGIIKVDLARGMHRLAFYIDDAVAARIRLKGALSKVKEIEETE